MPDRIICDPAILGGKPVIKGTRISVEIILELFSSGANYADILEARTPQIYQRASWHPI